MCTKALNLKLQLITLKRSQIG